MLYHGQVDTLYQETLMVTITHRRLQALLRATVTFRNAAVDK